MLAESLRAIVSGRKKASDLASEDERRIHPTDKDRTPYTFEEFVQYCGGDKKKAQEAWDESAASATPAPSTNSQVEQKPDAKPGTDHKNKMKESLARMSSKEKRIHPKDPKKAYTYAEFLTYVGGNWTEADKAWEEATPEGSDTTGSQSNGQSQSTWNGAWNGGNARQSQSASAWSGGNAGQSQSAGSGISAEERRIHPQDSTKSAYTYAEFLNYSGGDEKKATQKWNESSPEGSPKGNSNKEKQWSSNGSGSEKQWSNSGSEKQWSNSGSEKQWSNSGTDKQWSNSGSEKQWSNSGTDKQWSTKGDGGTQKQWSQPSNTPQGDLGGLPGGEERRVHPEDKDKVPYTYEEYVQYCGGDKRKASQKWNEASPVDPPAGSALLGSADPPAASPLLNGFDLDALLQNSSATSSKKSGKAKGNAGKGSVDSSQKLGKGSADSSPKLGKGSADSSQKPGKGQPSGEEERRIHPQDSTKTPYTFNDFVQYCKGNTKEATEKWNESTPSSKPGVQSAFKSPLVPGTQGPAGASGNGVSKGQSKGAGATQKGGAVMPKQQQGIKGSTSAKILSVAKPAGASSTLVAQAFGTTLGKGQPASSTPLSSAKPKSSGTPPVKGGQKGKAASSTGGDLPKLSGTPPVKGGQKGKAAEPKEPSPAPRPPPGPMQVRLRNFPSSWSMAGEEMLKTFLTVQLDTFGKLLGDLKISSDLKEAEATFTEGKMAMDAIEQLNGADLRSSMEKEEDSSVGTKYEGLVIQRMNEVKGQQKGAAGSQAQKGQVKGLPLSAAGSLTQKGQVKGTGKGLLGLGKEQKSNPVSQSIIVTKTVAEKTDDLSDENTVQKWVVHIDEIPMLQRPDVEPAPTDCEVFVEALDDSEIDKWAADFGEIRSVHLIPSSAIHGNGLSKGYIQFKTHSAAAACVEAGKAAWSESERVLSHRSASTGILKGKGKSGSKKAAYPSDVIGEFVGTGGRNLSAMKKTTEIEGICVGGVSGMRTVGSVGMTQVSESNRVHFVCRGTLTAFASLVAEMEQQLTQIHEGITAKIEEELMKEAQAEVGLGDEEDLSLTKADAPDDALFELGDAMEQDQVAAIETGEDLPAEETEEQTNEHELGDEAAACDSETATLPNAKKQKTDYSTEELDESGGSLVPGLLHTGENGFADFEGTWYITYDNNPGGLDGTYHFAETAEGCEVRVSKKRTIKLIEVGSEEDPRNDPNYLSAYLLDNVHREDTWEYIWLDGDVLRLHHFTGDDQGESPLGSANYWGSGIASREKPDEQPVQKPYSITPQTKAKARQSPLQPQAALRPQPPRHPPPSLRTQFGSNLQNSPLEDQSWEAPMSRPMVPEPPRHPPPQRALAQARPSMKRPGPPTDEEQVPEEPAQKRKPTPRGSIKALVKRE